MTRAPLPFPPPSTPARRAQPFTHRVNLHASPPAPPGRWLVLCDRGRLGQAVADALRDRGEDVIRVARLDTSRPMHRQTPAEVVLGVDAVDDFAALVEAMDTADRPLRGVVHLWSLDDLPVEGGQPLQSMAREAGLLAVTTALDRVQRTPRLWLITRGALPAEAGRPAPRQTLVWSFARVLSVAHPALRPTLVELDPAGSEQEGAVALTRALTASPDHRRLVSRRHCWYAPSTLDLSAIARDLRAA